MIRAKIDVESELSILQDKIFALELIASQVREDKAEQISLSVSLAEYLRELRTDINTIATIVGKQQAN
jgi:hypothetical protein